MLPFDALQAGTVPERIDGPDAGNDDHGHGHDYSRGSASLPGLLVRRVVPEDHNDDHNDDRNDDNNDDHGDDDDNKEEKQRSYVNIRGDHGMYVLFSVSPRKEKQKMERSTGPLQSKHTQKFDVFAWIGYD